ncbi:MAG: hypothetical protein ACYC7E_02715 [Armatimonadota bacterium]
MQNSSVLLSRDAAGGGLFNTTGDPLPDGASGRLVVAILTYHGETGVLTPLQPRPLSSADGTRLDACVQQLHQQDETLATLDEAIEAHVGAGGDAHALVTPEAAGFMSGPQKVLLESLALAPPAHSHDARYYTEAETDANLTAAPTGGVETRPRNIALRYLIRAKQVAGTDPLVQEANADTVDGFHASAFAVAGHRHDELYLLKSDAVPAYLVEMARVTTTTLATFTAATRYPHGLAYTSRGELFMHHHLVDNYPLSLCWSMIVEAKEATSITMQLQDNANTLAVYVDGALAWTRTGGYALATYTIALTTGEHRLQILTGGLGITDLWVNLNEFLSETVVWKRAATS